MIQISSIISFDPQIPYVVAFKIYSMDLDSGDRSDTFLSPSPIVFQGEMSYLDLVEKGKYIRHAVHIELFDDYVLSNERSSIVGFIGEILCEEMTIKHLPEVLASHNLNIGLNSIEFPIYKTPDRISIGEIDGSKIVVVGTESKARTNSKKKSSNHRKILEGLKEYLGSSSYTPSLNFSNIITASVHTNVPVDLFNLSCEISRSVEIEYEIVIPT